MSKSAGPDLEGVFMTVPHASVERAIDQAEPLTVDTAYARSHQAALAPSVVGAVGLEIETHLVDLDAVADRVAWDRVDPMPDPVCTAAGRSAITLEPGGQLELSGPPSSDMLSTISELRLDGQRTRLALADLGLGIAHAGADPLRPSRRVNPRPRYRAMEEHYAATGRGEPGAVMMNSTAALQVNLEAGPEDEWPERVARAHRLGPTMVAISASSPWLHGRDTGWKSARQRAWNGLDARACGPVPGCVAPDTDADDSLDPAAAWARYALRAPVAFVRTEGDDVEAVRDAGPVRALGQRRGPPGRPGPDRGRPRHPPDHAVPAGAAARLPGAALPRHGPAAVVAGHRRGGHHADGRPRRGRPGGRGHRADGPALDHGRAPGPGRRRAAPTRPAAA